uniref:C-type lectin domain-containing protein n=1 Tax=Branchiostoma floridae TaxID=7739 RepID=C3ZR94_BRAFL|eukprot:XP_002588956.1 hypothetical protein BRAFLDRAFT_89147 [Branchiostoma floridae]
MAEACDGYPTVVPPNFGDGSPTGVFCDQPTSGRARLVRQPKSNTNEKPYMCRECGYRAAVKSHLSQHMRTHTGDKPFKCDQCDYSAAQKSSLDLHLAKHTGDKPYMCGECGYRTAKRSHLANHMRTHTGDKPFKCDQCDYSTAYKPNLDRHLSKHTGDKPYMCGECGYRAAEKSALVKHMRTHTGEKPYKCDQCYYSAAQRCSLDQHLAHHTGDKPYMCGECGYRTAKKCYLSRHMRSQSTVMYEQAEPVQSPLSRPDSGQTSGPPPQPPGPPVHQGGSRGRVRHGNGPSDKMQEDQEASSHTYEEAEVVKGYATCTSADHTYPGGPSRGAFCSFIRSHRSCIAAGIAVLFAVGLAPLTFINKEEISQLSTALKRDQDDMRQLSTTVDALKRDQEDMRQLFNTFDALKRDRDQDDMSTTVDDMSTTVDALKRDQDDMSTTVDALKRGLDSDKSRVTALEQRRQEIRYTVFRGICYKAFDKSKSFSDAAAACGEDGGTLAMPRDAETNAFLISLYKSVSDKGVFWFGLHDRREEGTFEWVDGSALGTYNSWALEQPDIYHGNADCVSYSAYWEDKWVDFSCNWQFRYICQAIPVLEWNPQGKRRRPRLSWRRGVMKDLQHAKTSWQEAKTTAKDRGRWRHLTEALCSRRGIED